MNGKISYARRLGIDLRSRREEELFKWFLACLLFGKPIQTEIAEQAYREIVAAGLVSPAAILRAGWDKLVQLLDRAHYVRYDFSTATKLLDVSRELTERYGTMTNLLAQAETPSRLSRKLQEFKHVGPVTARIFLRELRPLWRRKSRAAGAKRARAGNGNRSARGKLRPRSTHRQAERKVDHEKEAGRNPGSL